MKLIENGYIIKVIRPKWVTPERQNSCKQQQTGGLPENSLNTYEIIFFMLNRLCKLNVMLSEGSHNYMLLKSMSEIAERASILKCSLVASDSRDNFGTSWSRPVVLTTKAKVIFFNSKIDNS